MQAYKRNKLGIDLKIDDYKDSGCYKVELSKDEYVQLLLEIDRLKEENHNQIVAYEQKMTIEQAKANQKFLEMKKELSADISYLKDRIENDTEYKKLVMQQKNDSCVDRGVSKKSSGYFFLDAIEWREKVSGYSEKIVTWKYVIQTPFLSAYPRRTVEDTANVVIDGKICTEGFHIDKMVQLDGEKDWHESVKAKPGERIKFRIRFFNDGETALNNVVIADNLPAGLVYEADTLEVYRGIDTAISRINPVDANLSDNNVTVNVDKVAAKEVIYTYFYAHSNGDLAAECGDEKSVTNTVKGKYNNDDSTEQTDTADVIVVTEVCEEKNPGFIINKMVQLDGGSDWYETVTAKAGEKIRYRIQFKNTGETTLENVVIRDIIPANVNYVAGTTILYNAKGEQSNPGDGIVSTDGIKIGNYNPGEEATIYFYATVSSSLDECADYTFTNVVKGKYNNDDSTEKSDTADVTVNGVVCTPPELPKTGAGSIVSGVLGLASVSTAAAYYVASRKKLN